MGPTILIVVKRLGSYKSTYVACFIGYGVQAIVNTFLPLLFLTFQDSYGIPLEQITLLVTINFLMQLSIDALSGKFVEKIGYRKTMIIAHAFAFIGLGLLAFLPDLLPSAFAGLLISVIVYSLGGGLLEVVVSPIVEACPSKNKETTMSLLHSFYCWGYVLVVGLSTLYFFLFGTDKWQILALVWAVVPLFNLIFNFFVPYPDEAKEKEAGMRVIQLLKSPVFILMFLMIMASGAGEQAISQWVPSIAESLGIGKTLADLLGPLTFALAMGLSRLLFALAGKKINLNAYMGISVILLICSYLLICLSPWPWLSLLGSALAGFSVSIMWPGVLSKAAVALPLGGASMYAILALGGDLGATVGPSLVGYAASFFDDDLKIGVAFGIVFPAILAICLFVSMALEWKKAKKEAELSKRDHTAE